jgi:surfeit locus 1 family protein
LTHAWRRLVWPGLTTLAMLLIMLGLGTWQLQRLAWKRALLAAIDTAEASPGQPWAPNLPPFSKVAVDGTIPPGPPAYYGTDLRQTPTGATLGSYLITPLRLAGGTVILVNHGWVATATTAPPPGGTVHVEGYLRPGERRHWFSAADNPATRQFYTLDPAAIAATLGQAKVEPVVLVALGPAPVAGVPVPAATMPRPPNDHLSYAITWFSLAAVLAVIFLLHARKVLRA